MKSQALAFSVLLLLGTTLSEVSARPAKEVDLMYELGMLSMSLQGTMENISKKVSKIFASLSEIGPVQYIRNYVNELGATITMYGEEFLKKLEKEIKKMEKEIEKKKIKHEETNQEKENPPQVAQEN